MLVSFLHSRRINAQSTPLSLEALCSQHDALSSAHRPAFAVAPACCARPGLGAALAVVAGTNTLATASSTQSQSLEPATRRFGGLAAEPGCRQPLFAAVAKPT